MLKMGGISKCPFFHWLFFQIVDSLLLKVNEGDLYLNLNEGSPFETKVTVIDANIYSKYNSFLFTVFTVLLSLVMLILFQEIYGSGHEVGCLVTWLYYQMIAKPANKTSAPSWPDPYIHTCTVFAFSMALQDWDGTAGGCLNPSSWKTEPHLSCLVVADILGPISISAKKSYHKISWRLKAGG